MQHMKTYWSKIKTKEKIRFRYFFLYFFRNAHVATDSGGFKKGGAGAVVSLPYSPPNCSVSRLFAYVCAINDDRADTLSSALPSKFIDPPLVAEK